MNWAKTLQPVLDRAVAEGELAGGNLLVRCNGHDVAYIESGLADTDGKTAIRRDSIFRLYSQSKPITAAAVAILAERGILDLYDPVERYLPGFRNQKIWTKEGLVPSPRPAILLDLLSMTAGLCYGEEPGAGVHTAAVLKEAEQQICEGGGIGTVELMNRIGQQPLLFAPGEDFHYSLCADVLGAVVEIASGKPFAEFLQDELFGPMNMKDTAFWVPKDKLSRLVTCYRRTPEGLRIWDDLHLAVGEYTREPAFASGGAGLVSTLDDYSHFAQMLIDHGVWRGRRILGEGTVQWLTSPLLDSRKHLSFWFGLEGFTYGKLMRVCIEPGRYGSLARPGEYGWDGWLGTYFANMPDIGVTFLFAQNTTDTGTSRVVRQLRNTLLSRPESIL